MSAYDVDVHSSDEVRYEDWRDHVQALAEQELEEDAYESDDPKSPGFHDRAADAWDMRDKFAPPKQARDLARPQQKGGNL